MQESKKEIWTVLYDTKPDSLGLVSKTFELAEQCELSCRVVFVSPVLTKEDTVSLAESGAPRITHIPVQAFNSNSEFEIRNCLAELIKKEGPEIVLFISSVFSSTVAPGVAALLKVGITADCTQFYWDEKGNFIQTRPTYGGRTLADIRSNTLPIIATVRRGMFQAKRMTVEKPPLADVQIPGKEADFCEILGSISDRSPLDLSRAEIIFSGGAGLGSKEAFERLYELASRTGGEVAASRGAVAAGFARYDRQVGQTGVVVRPRLYIAFGISGAVQHLSGMVDSEKIIAINTDRKAPIHSISHYSLYADANEVIARLLEMLPQKDSDL